jgi:glycosyltransferase involved in cell wall biosynthesis
MMSELPACTVIVPTLDRPRPLATCLQALARLDYPEDRLQVVVVDDGSATPLEASVLGDHGPRDLTVLRQERAGPAAARNAGAAHATGALLAFVDDDCVPRSDWLRRIAQRWVAGPEEGVGGRTVNALPHNLCSAAAQLVIDVGYRQNNDDHGDASRRWFTTNNLAVAAAGFREVGGFDPSYRTAEDRDFCSRWAESGRRLAHEPAAVVEHAKPLDVSGFARLHFAYGRGAYRYHRGRRQRGRPVAIESSYYAKLVRAPFQREGPGRAVSLAGLLLLWHVASTAGFLFEWARVTRPRAVSSR